MSGQPVTILQSEQRPQASGDGTFVDLAEAERSWSRLGIVSAILLGAASLHALFVLFLGLRQPLLDLHSFRQTQTAISAYWLWRGGPWLSYQTPAVGYPWSIPFEFPVYQGAVALLRLIGVPIDIGGRLISFSFYLGALWPLWLLFRSVRLGRHAFLVVGVLFLSSPLYLYWSRAVMIESTALFFGLLWLALLAAYLSKPRVAILVFAILAGMLGVLAKSTTFPAFLVLGGLLIVMQVRREGLAALRRRGVLLALVACFAPLVPAYAWVAYSDAVKSHNAIGQTLTSTVLSQWNLGTWSQKTSRELWHDLMLQRILPDILGYGLLIAVAMLGAAFASRRYAAPTLAALAAFLTPLCVFTNLHIIHNYYQYANGIFALAAVGLGITSLAEARRRRTAVILLLGLAALQVGYFWQVFGGYLTTDYSNNQLLRISLAARDSIPADSSLLVIGTDWSSVIPYYSERKSLAIPYWASPALVQQMLGKPQAFLGNQPFAGVVYCADNLQSYVGTVSLLQAFIANRKILAAAGACQLLAAQR